MKVLYLEDSPTAARANTKILEKKFGFEVINAKDSKEAFKAVQTNYDIDIFLCDIDLRSSEIDNRNGTDGINVAHKLVKEYIVPVILFTAYDEDDYREKAEELLSGYTWQFVPKKILNNNEERLYTILLSTIDNFYHKNYMAESSLLAKRKIGLRTSQNEPYIFYNHENILFLYSSEKMTHIVLNEKAENGKNKEVIISATLKATTKRIQFNFPNIILLGRRHAVNLEKIHKLEGNQLYLNNYDFTLKLHGAWEASLLRHKLLIRSH